MNWRNLWFPGEQREKIFRASKTLINKILKSSSGSIHILKIDICHSKIFYLKEMKKPPRIWAEKNSIISSVRKFPIWVLENSRLEEFLSRK